MAILGWTSPEEVKEIKAELENARKSLDTAIAAHIKEETALRTEINILTSSTKADQAMIAQLNKQVDDLQKQLDYNTTRLARLDELERTLPVDTQPETPMPPTKANPPSPQRPTRGGKKS